MVRNSNHTGLLFDSDGLEVLRKRIVSNQEGENLQISGSDVRTSEAGTCVEV